MKNKKIANRSVGALFEYHLQDMSRPQNYLTLVQSLKLVIRVCTRFPFSLLGAGLVVFGQNRNSLLGIFTERNEVAAPVASLLAVFALERSEFSPKRYQKRTILSYQKWSELASFLSIFSIEKLDRKIFQLIAFRVEEKARNFNLE